MFLNIQNSITIKLTEFFNKKFKKNDFVGNVAVGGDQGYWMML